MEYTQKQLEEMVVGKSAKPRAYFFEKAALNVAKSNEAGRRIYDKKLYVRPIQTGVTDSISYLAQKSDIVEFRDEYEEFLRTRQGSQTSVSVSVIPNLDLAHMQELIDMKLTTIAALAQAEAVPPHLEYARQSAIALDAVLKEQANDQQKDHQEEEILKHGTGAARIEAAEVGSHSDVPPVGGSEHLRRERRQDVAPSIGDRDAEDTEGLREGGRPHHRQGTVDDWSFTFQLTA